MGEPYPVAIGTSVMPGRRGPWGARDLRLSSVRLGGQPGGARIGRAHRAEWRPRTVIGRWRIHRPCRHPRLFPATLADAGDDPLEGRLEGLPIGGGATADDDDPAIAGQER